MTDDRVVIIGASLAGGNAALSLRENGFDGQVTLVGAESRPPYERPPLSKEIMQGERDDPDWVLEDGTWDSKQIELRLGVTADRLDAAARTVTLASGETLGYDKLVLATGAAPQRPPIPGASDALTLRTLDDALAIRRAAKTSGKVALIGGGWIGCEVAASLRQQGVEVELLDAAPRLLAGLGSDEVSARLLRLHRSQGVGVTLGAEVKSIGGGAVELADGRVAADVIVLAAGVAPRLELARSAGLREAAGGVAVDATLRTSDQHISAIGDLAAIEHPVYGKHLRVEHWDVAQKHGEFVGRVLAGKDEPYTRIPFFFSDQYELGFEYRGWFDPAGPAPEVVLRGDDPSAEWFAFWLVDGAVQAVMNANAWDDSEALWRLASDRPRISADRLRDPSIPLAEL